MKKLIALLLVLVMLFTLAGCGEVDYCEYCGEKDDELQTEWLDGEKMKLCDECAELVDNLTELENLLD